MDREEALKILQYTDAQCNGHCETCIFNDKNDHCILVSVQNAIAVNCGCGDAVMEARNKYGTIAKEISLQELYITLKDFRLNMCETQPCAECPFFKSRQCCLFEAQIAMCKVLNIDP